MAVLLLLTLALALTLTLTRGGAPCPGGCRCYSLTVECGSAHLREVPKYIPPSTQTVFLQDNRISQIRRLDLSQLTHLHYLYLQNNTISGLESGSFQDQGQLLELALNGNRIHLVRADMFQGLDQLRILYLSRNEITRLLDYTFRGLQRLQELHLQQNSIEQVQARALVGLGSLALLDLSSNSLQTLEPAALRPPLWSPPPKEGPPLWSPPPKEGPPLSLQELRLTDNPWRCDCALTWLRGWMRGGGQRLLGLGGRRLLCAEPPRLAGLALLEVPPNSLVCIPPLLQLSPRRLALGLGESLRVSCHASGYPRPQVTWRKAAQSKAPPAPRGLVQDSGAPEAPPPEAPPPEAPPPEAPPPEAGGRFDPDTGSGMLFLSNVTAAHAGLYECEAWNAGGVARLTFQLAINSSGSPGPLWAAWAPPAWAPPAGPGPRGPEVSRQPLPALGSMAFGALGAATQAAIAAGISLLSLTAMLLMALICSRRQGGKEPGGHTEDSVLFVDYSDGPTTFAQLEEFRDERGHEMFVLNRARPVLPPPAPPGLTPPPPAPPGLTPPPPAPPGLSPPTLGSTPPSDSSSQGRASSPSLNPPGLNPPGLPPPGLPPPGLPPPGLNPPGLPPPGKQPEPSGRRVAGEGGEAEPVLPSEAEGGFLNHPGMFIESQIAYEIHC